MKIVSQQLYSIQHHNQSIEDWIERNVYKISHLAIRKCIRIKYILLLTQILDFKKKENSDCETNSSWPSILMHVLQPNLFFVRFKSAFFPPYEISVPQTFFSCYRSYDRHTFAYKKTPCESSDLNGLFFSPQGVIATDSLCSTAERKNGCKNLIRFSDSYSVNVAKISHRNVTFLP